MHSTPPKYIRVITLNANTGKPVPAELSFTYTDMDMRFGSTDRSGRSPVYPALSNKLTIAASADHYLSEYLTMVHSQFIVPQDTIEVTLRLLPVKVTGKFTFDNIYFFTDSDSIRPESTPDLHRLLAVLQRNGDSYIEIQGHMNYPIDRPKNPNQDRYNLELSFKRAKAVNDYLVTSGIAQERLTYRGMSNSRMRFPLPASREQEDQNKRVEVYTLKVN